MKHDWKNVHGSEMRDISTYGRRVCRNCGKEQEKFAKHEWMRVVGYHWYPKVGRCKKLV